ncbi:nucleolar complex protein 4 homolog B-like isoform X2 [Chenopodium quinoa]|uniref:nucleolar complex protein 4 homolog B-like isoform X2 n=1 Tax=Chenopodium quinoa TaxID=63459 RepID=UPI000B76EE1A|nr:nucleolar complex protein 4 homolog B-like isoform X2 [Chenopodium quinoa]
MAHKKTKTTAATTTTTTGIQKKRDKRSISNLKTKKAKTAAAAATTTGDERSQLDHVQQLGQQLLSSKAHTNNLHLLLTYISPSSPPSLVVESLLSLQSFFHLHISTLPASSNGAAANSAASDPDVIYRTWLRSKFDDLVKSLLHIAVSPLSDELVREIVLDTLMEFVQLGNGEKFYSALYHKLIQAIICSSLEAEFLLEVLASKYFKYVDVRYFTFITVEKLCKTLESNNSSGDKAGIKDKDDSKASLECSIKKIHFILSHIPPLGNVAENDAIEMWSKGFLSKEGDQQEDAKHTEGKNKQKKREKITKNDVPLGSVSKKMKLKFTKAWMSFLRLPLPLDVYKEVLVNLHLEVIPYLSNPVMLCDFLTRSYDIGGVVSVMALSGLFILMTKYGLEYPNFYEKLYALLIPSIFMAKHRAKFFELLDSCLKSPLLPAYLAAAFTKKLSRLSLAVPPSGALVIIALIHNLLRRHPSINCLVHREIGEETNKDDTKTKQESVSSDGNAGVGSDVASEKGVDLFNNEERDPLRSKAMRSSLWEIDTLRHHYCPPVSRFVLSLENDLTVRAKTAEVMIDDFSSGSYATIFREEMRRRVKKVPLADYAKATPTSLFSESEFPGWSFKYDGTNEEVKTF